MNNRPWSPSSCNKTTTSDASNTASSYPPEGRSESISVIRPDNARSIRVATALGARPERTVEFFGAPALIYRYPAPA